MNSNVQNMTGSKRARSSSPSAWTPKPIAYRRRRLSPGPAPPITPTPARFEETAKPLGLAPVSAVDRSPTALGIQNGAEAYEQVRSHIHSLLYFPLYILPILFPFFFTSLSSSLPSFVSLLFFFPFYFSPILFPFLLYFPSLTSLLYFLSLLLPFSLYFPLFTSLSPYFPPSLRPSLLYFSLSLFPPSQSRFRCHACGCSCSIGYSAIHGPGTHPAMHRPRKGAVRSPASLHA